MSPQDAAQLVAEHSLLTTVGGLAALAVMLVISTFFWMVRRMFTRLSKGDGNGLPSLQKLDGRLDDLHLAVRDLQQQAGAIEQRLVRGDRRMTAIEDRLDHLGR